MRNSMGSNELSALLERGEESGCLNVSELNELIVDGEYDERAPPGRRRAPLGLTRERVRQLESQALQRLSMEREIDGLRAA